MEGVVFRQSTTASRGSSNLVVVDDGQDVAELDHDMLEAVLLHDVADMLVEQDAVADFDLDDLVVTDRCDSPFEELGVGDHGVGDEEAAGGH